MKNIDDPNQGSKRTIKEQMVQAIRNDPAPAPNDKKRGPKSRKGTLYRVAKNTGIAAGSLSRFMSGKSSISIETLQKLCDYFGFELVIVDNCNDEDTSRNVN